MYEYYFTFRSMTLAQRASIELSKHGIAALFLRTPKVVSDLGCGYAVRVLQIDGRRTASILRSVGIRFEKVFFLEGDNTKREVWL